LKKLVGGVVLLWCLFPANSVAQRGGGGHGGFATGAVGGGGFVGSGFRGNSAFRIGNIGLPPVGPIPSQGFTRPLCPKCRWATVRPSRQRTMRDVLLSLSISLPFLSASLLWVSGASK